MCNPSDKSVLWGFISRYEPKATPNNSPYLDHLAEFAIRYYNDFVKAHKSYLAPSEKHKAILQDILDMLKSLPEQIEAESIQKGIYDIGMKAGDMKICVIISKIYTRYCLGKAMVQGLALS